MRPQRRRCSACHKWRLISGQFPHSARSHFLLYARIMQAFFHCCGRHSADLQSTMKSCSLICKLHPPYIIASAGMSSRPADFYFLWDWKWAFPLRQRMNHQDLGCSAMLVDKKGSRNRWRSHCMAGCLATQPILWW